MDPSAAHPRRKHQAERFSQRTVGLLCHLQGDDGAAIIGHLLGSNSNAVVNQAAQRSGLSLGQTLKILSIAAPLIMSLLGKTAQSQQAQQVQTQQAQSSVFTPLTQSAQTQQQSALGGINVGSIMGALLKNVDVGKILLSLLK